MCVYFWIYIVYIHTHTHIYKIYLHTQTHRYIYTHIHIHIHTYIKYICTHKHTDIYIYTHTYLHICVCVCGCLHACRDRTRKKKRRESGERGGKIIYNPVLHKDLSVYGRVFYVYMQTFQLGQRKLVSQTTDVLTERIGDENWVMTVGKLPSLVLSHLFGPSRASATELFTWRAIYAESYLFSASQISLSYWLLLYWVSWCPILWYYLQLWKNHGIPQFDNSAFVCRIGVY